MMQLCISRILKVIETEAKPNVHRKRAREDQLLLFLFCFFLVATPLRVTKSNSEKAEVWAAPHT